MIKIGRVDLKNDPNIGCLQKTYIKFDDIGRLSKMVS